MTQSPTPSATTALAQEDGFARVLRAHHDRLAVLVRRLLGWPSAGGDVDDVLQNAYLTASTKRHTFRGDGPEAAWLHRIAVHHARNHVRSRRRRQRLLALFEHSDANRLGAAADSTVEPSSETLADAMRQAMAQLAHRDREVLVLRYLEDRAIEDLAGHRHDRSRDATQHRPGPAD